MTKRKIESIDLTLHDDVDYSNKKRKLNKDKEKSKQQRWVLMTQTEEGGLVGNELNTKHPLFLPLKKSWKTKDLPIIDDYPEVEVEIYNLILSINGYSDESIPSDDNGIDIKADYIKEIREFLDLPLLKEIDFKGLLTSNAYLNEGNTFQRILLKSRVILMQSYC